jgi:hypothetical protein
MGQSFKLRFARLMDVGMGEEIEVAVMQEWFGKAARFIA